MTPMLFSVSYAGLWGQHRLDLKSFLARARALGYPAVELMGKRPHLSVLDEDDRSLAALRDAAATAGVHVSGARTAALRTETYHHALATGFSRGFLVSAGILVLALIIALAVVRVSRQDLSGADPMPEPTGDATASSQSSGPGAAGGGVPGTPGAGRRVDRRIRAGVRARPGKEDDPNAPVHPTRL